MFIIKSRLSRDFLFKNVFHLFPPQAKRGRPAKRSRVSELRHAYVSTHPVFAQPLNLPSLLLRRKEGKRFVSPLSVAGEERSASEA